LSRLAELGYEVVQMKVFLSCATVDNKWAKQLRERLAHAGLEVWDPNREVLPGQDWSGKISGALRDSDAMVVLVSPQAAESDSVRREIEYALGSPRYAHRLIPVVIRPTRKLPWILEQRKMVPLNNNIERAAREIVKRLEQGPERGKEARAAAH
jgi:hypothetical protein